MEGDIQGMPNVGREHKQIASHTNRFQQTQFETSQQRGGELKTEQFYWKINARKMLIVHFSDLWGFGKSLQGLGRQQELPCSKHPFPWGIPSLPLTGGQVQVTVTSPSSPPQLPGMQTQSIPCSRSSCWNPSGLFCLQNHPSYHWWSSFGARLLRIWLGLPCSLINHLANKKPKKAARQPHMPEFSSHLEHQVVLPEHPNDYKMSETSGLPDVSTRKCIHGKKKYCLKKAEVIFCNAIFI